MQDVNNDMDDLFRRAAERYPLKTDGADWQKVSAGLQAASTPVAEEKEKRKRRALWLFLLLPLGLLWSVYYKSDNQPAQRTVAAKGNAVSEGSRSSLQKEDFTSNKKTSSKEETKDSTAVAFSPDETKIELKVSTTSDDKVLPTYNNKKSLIREDKTNVPATGFVRSKNKEKFGDKQAATQNNTDAAGSDKNNFSTLQPDASLTRIDKAEAQMNNKDEMANQTKQAKADSTAFSDIKRDSSANNPNSNNKNAQTKVKPHIQHSFYVGVLPDFDVSTVKLQRINKTGYGLQVLAGYRFSNRFSVETGLGWSLKNYYSKGKYFDKKNAKIPDAVNIYFTNGNCKMLEVPLNVKYDFALRKKSNLFVTAGLSSYFMKKENYSYTGDYMGWVYDTTRHYNNSVRNLFSVASLSIGYQLQLNKHLSLRAEPYIKMPLGGIGTAKLPITSTGISVGFTRSF